MTRHEADNGAIWEAIKAFYYSRKIGDDHAAIRAALNAYAKNSPLSALIQPLEARLHNVEGPDFVVKAAIVAHAALHELAFALAKAEVDNIHA